MALTRRAFLQITGGALLTGGLLPDGLPELQQLPLVGRVLRYSHVLEHPQSGTVIRALWPDSVVKLEGATGAWYRVAGGVVARRDLQPMAPYDPANVRVPRRLPRVMTVAAPVAPVRAWAAGDAPLVARIGYGGVARMIDALTEFGTGWYAVQDSDSPEGPPLGWTLAERWTLPPELTFGTPPHGTPCLLLDRTAAEARFVVGGRAIARFPAAVGPDVQVGRWRVAFRRACRPVGGQHGAGWHLGWPGGMLYGAHWHHDFGGPGTEPGWAVAPWAACWLYAHASQGMAVEVL